MPWEREASGETRTEGGEEREARARVDGAGRATHAGGMAARSGKADRFPRAPTQLEWDALSPEERARVVDALPGVNSGWEMLLAPEEVLARLEQLSEELRRRVAEEARLSEELRRRADEEARRADEEARLRREAQRPVEELRAELERLRRGSPP